MGLDGTKSNLSPDAAQYLGNLERQLKTAVDQISSIRGDVDYLKKRVVANGDATIPDNSITTPKIADGAVTDAKIASVASAKISGDVANADTVSVAAYSRNAVGPATWYAVWMNASRQLMRNTSSRRFKENIKSYQFGRRALGLKPVEYDRIGGGHEYGLIAEQVFEHVPEIVTWFKHPDSDDEAVIDGVRYDLLSVALLDIVRDQEERILALEAALSEKGVASNG